MGGDEWFGVGDMALVRLVDACARERRIGVTGEVFKGEKVQG